MLIACGVFDHQCSPNCKGARNGEDYIVCPVCEQRDPNCPYCLSDRGLVRIGCPYREVDDETWDLLDAAKLIKQGGWPNGVGWANEPQALVDGVHRVWREFERVQPERET